MSTKNTMSETLIQDVWIDGLHYWKVDDTLIAPISGGETPPNPGEGDPPPSSDGPPIGKDGKPFDAERAQSTIEALRNEIKTLKGTGKELDAAKARLKEIDDASKSETERLASKAAEAEQKLAEAEQRAADLALQITVERAAGKLGFHDPDDAYRLIDRRAVELDNDGEPKNVDALLAALAKAKPHLVRAEGDEKAKPAAGATRAVPATPKPAGSGSQTREQDIDKRIEVLNKSGSYPRF